MTTKITHDWGWRCALGCLVACFLLGASLGRAEGPTPQTHVFYRPVLSGVVDFSLRDALTSSLVLFQNQKSPPQTVGVLKNWAQDDMKAALQTLAMKGYYDAQVDYTLDFSTDPLTVNFMVTPGTPYTLGAFTIQDTTHNTPFLDSLALNPAVLGVQVGGPASMDLVREAVSQLFMALGNNGYPYAVLVHQEATVDHTTRTLNVKIQVDPGKLMTFGPPQYQLGNGVNQKVIDSRLQWKAGETYSNLKVMKTIEILNNTKLFSFIKITRPPLPPQDGRVNMLIEAQEGNPKNIDYYAGYEGSSGVNVSLGWEKNDVVTTGDFVKLKGFLGQTRSGLSFEHIVPDFGWVDAELRNKIELTRWRHAAYESWTGHVAGRFTTPIVSLLKGYIGYDAVVERLAPKGQSLQGTPPQLAPIPSSTPIVVALHLGVFYESFDDALFPRKGWDARLDVFPFFWIDGKQLAIQGLLAQRIFLPLNMAKSLILSAWYKVGVSPGVSPGTIPLDRLFFAGGLGTVRGYQLEYAGPLSPQGVPLGGRSMLTFGGELLYYLASDLAIKGFADMGTVLDSQYPDLGHRFFLGVGGGVQYESVLGKLMVDVGFPVNRRPQDKAAQIYVSLSNEV